MAAAGSTHSSAQSAHYHTADSLSLYLLRGLYPAGWPLSSILPSVLEVGLSDNRLKHFYPKKERKGEIKQIHSVVKIYT